MKKAAKAVKKGLPAEGSLHRFVVSSAQEAVLQIREKLGPEAEVLSVKQVKGSGLERFLSSPKLEVVAQIKPAAELPVNAVNNAAQDQPTEASEPSSSKKQSDIPEVKKDPLLQTEASVDKQMHTQEVASEELEALPKARRSSLLGRIRKQSNSRDLTCHQFLEKAGLSPRLLARMSSDNSWRGISEAPLSTGMMQAVSWLKSYRKELPHAALTNRVAFLGSAGVGKTTALCKLLARDVFIAGKCPQVLRMEVDRPHMDEGLSMYCEVLGVPYYRSEAEVDFMSDELIYLDFPGYSCRDLREQERLLSVLDRLAFTTRVIVVNAAYEESVLDRSLESAQRLGVTHQVLTHVDELTQSAKLWSFLLDPERSLLFISNGQNVAGDRIDDVMGYLLERTFPQ
jgi:flagellar biosynthesis protein FlhF